MTIEPMTAARFDAFWPAMAAILRAGDTYTLEPDLDREAARSYWCHSPERTFAALDSDGAVLGSYYLKRNAGGGGAHVCNCGYMTAPGARGRGVASALCEHSQRVAVDLGYRAMQFNAVVSTNVGAVRLWQHHGFAIVGTVPGAFRHPEHGDVDLHVMHKALV